MTTTRVTDTVRPLTDHRPGQGLAASGLVAGGVLFAIGNLLHPLRHDDAATQAPTWAAAHLTFALGALLMAGGVASLGRRLAVSRVGVIGLVLTAVGMVFTVGSAYVEVYVAPVVGHDTMHAIEEGAGVWGVFTLLTYVVGPVLIAIAGWRHHVLPVLACISVIVAQLLMLAVPALPSPEGLWIIPGTVVFGLSFAVLGWLVRHDATRGE